MCGAPAGPPKCAPCAPAAKKLHRACITSSSASGSLGGFFHLHPRLSFTYVAEFNVPFLSTNVNENSLFREKHPRPPRKGASAGAKLVFCFQGFWKSGSQRHTGRKTQAVRGRLTAHRKGLLSPARQNKPCHPGTKLTEAGAGRPAVPFFFAGQAGRARGLGAVHHLQARHTTLFQLAPRGPRVCVRSEDQSP